MTFNNFFATFTLVALTVLSATSLQAGQITGFTWFPGIASVALDPIAPPVAPNNDNVVGPSPNEILITQKAYTAIGPVDIVFDVISSGGVTEYLFMEGVDNGTGIDWSGYRMELGFGTGSGFSLSPTTDELDFDAPDFDSPVPGASMIAFFPTITPATDVLIGSGGVQPNGAFTTPLHVFSIDVPDGITEFTLRQIPIGVPEPATVILLAVGFAFVGTNRRSCA